MVFGFFASTDDELDFAFVQARFTHGRHCLLESPVR